MHKKDCVRNAKRTRNIVFNSIFLIIDVIILLSVLSIFVISIILLCAICFMATHKCDCEFMLFMGKIFGSSFSMSGLIAAFGTATSIFFVPIISYFTSSHVAMKRNEKRISEALAEAQSLSFFIAKMPYGIWNGLEQAYYNHCLQSHKELSSWDPLICCNYCFSMVFNGAFFQSYDIDVTNMGYESYYEHEKKLRKPHISYFEYYTNFVSDTSGISKGPFAEGTNIVALFNNSDISPLLYYLSPPYPYTSKNVFYDLHIEENDESDKGIFYQMYGKNNCQRFFPLIRWLFQLSMKHHKNWTSYRVKLSLNDLPIPLSKNMSKFQMDVLDVDIQTIRLLRKKR